MPLDKTYRPAEVEARLYDAWEASGAFAPRAAPGAPAYCIVLPPPNVTGSLHMGHALDHTMQDVLVRFHRMRGFETLWQPGTDHAGIATQMVVERELARSGSNVGRREMGREAFVAKVWEWKERSGGTIVQQMRRLGASCDWSRQRFTLDEGLSAAVRRAFVQLWKDGLVYRDKRLVSWDCQLQTAVSDLEVQSLEVDGHLWHIAYPIEGSDRTITVATTRPETMLGDTAIAVHPDDARYRDLVGRHAVLPLVGRRIPIVADAYSDPEKGTGAVKITPAHDFNDFEVGRRHALPMIAVLDELGRVNANAPEAYRGLDRLVARKRIVADLEAQGRLVKVEKHRHAVPHGDRSGTPLEPFLTDQWYCDAGKLAAEAIRAVEDGRTRFVPESWSATYFEWMRNIQPWCISRQLWWGHQIPAWHAPDGRIFVAETEPEAQAQADAHHGEPTLLARDPDVLDTWFSSGLWSFSTLGWPEATREQQRFHPTSTLVTGFDIIFFWVARMMMLSLHLKGEVPFREVVIHGLVRDERGQKMSKTKGNVVDPLDVVDQYGADALRLALMASATQGRDVRFGTSRVEGYRNFVTKLWNAARFIEMSVLGADGSGRLDAGLDPRTTTLALNRWLVGETAKAVLSVTKALAEHRFNDATLAAYHFVWETVCDWWIELAKPLLASEEVLARDETRAVAGWALAQVLHLLHPLAPFVTEELWERLYGAPGGRLIVAEWPTHAADLVDAVAEAEISQVVELIGAVRAIKSEYGIANGVAVTALVTSGPPLAGGPLRAYAREIERLARVTDIIEDAAVPKLSASIATSVHGFAVPLGDVIDVAAERARLDRDLARAAVEREKLLGRLGNEAFLAKALPEVIQEQKERLQELDALILRLEAARRRIS